MPTLAVERDGVLDVLYEAQPHQVPYHESALPNLLMVGPRGTGKTLAMRMDAHMRAMQIPRFRYLVIRRTMPELKRALALETPIPTPQGWTTMGDLKEGQQVFAPDGQPTTILWKSEAQIDPNGTYEVEFDNGEKIIASAGHRWRVLTRSGQANHTPSCVMTTEEMAPRVRVGSDSRANFSIGLSAKWITPQADLPIDPYVLGVWLGDGTSRQGAFTTIDPEIVEEVRKAGYSVVKRPAHPLEWSIRGLQSQLRLLGILCDKAVPSIYEHGSYEQRLALLQGLMDTDGCCSEEGLCIFSQVGKRKHIADAVFRLAASLGLKPRRFTQKVKKFSSTEPNGNTAYGVRWVGDVPVFRLPRKSRRLRPLGVKGSKAKAHYILNIRRISDVVCQCISVDHPSHEYLVGLSSIPTHNSHLQYINSEMARLGGNFHNTDSIARYPNESLGYYGYCDTEADMLKFLSSEYDLVVADEITTFPRETILKIMSCARVPEGSGRVAMLRGGTNPLGVGAEFVRKYFIDKTVTPEENADYDPTEWGTLTHRMTDNKYLDVEQYRKRLQALPEHVRRAWLDGEWVVEGQYFTDFRPMKDGQPWHVIMELPRIRGVSILSQPWVSIYRAIDWGYSPDPAVCLWIAVLPNKRAIVFKERTWKETLAADVAAAIKRESAGMKIVETFCLPLNAPVWMGDYSFKSLSEVKVGDEVISGPPKGQKFAKVRGQQIDRKYTASWKKAHKGKYQRYLQRATVTAVHRTRQEVIKVVFASGRSVYCTRDHKWLCGSCYQEHFVVPRVGATLVHVVDDPGPANDPLIAAWLGGMYDGEGCRELIAQSPTHNPDLYVLINERLRHLGFETTACKNGIRWKGGVQGSLKFVSQVPSIRYRTNWADYFLLRSHYRTKDKVVAIESCGVQDVGCITTTTGNFVAYGYITSNCDPTMCILDGKGAYGLSEIFERNGVPLTPSVNKRDAYGYAIHNYLNTVIDVGDGGGAVPQLQLLAEQGLYGCPKLIQTLPTLQVDPKDPTKVADGNDHWMCALAYFALKDVAPARDPETTTLGGLRPWQVPKWRQRLVAY